MRSNEDPPAGPTPDNPTPGDPAGPSGSGGPAAGGPGWGVPGAGPSHPVVAAVEQLEAALDTVGGAAVWSVPDDQLLELLPRVSRLHNRIEGTLMLPLTEQARRTTAAQRAGAGSLRSWLAGKLRISDGAAKRTVAQAEALDTRLPATGAALAAGDVSVGHVRVIVEAVTALAEDLPAGVVIERGPGWVTDLQARADAFLADQARDLTVAETKILGTKLLEYLEPEAAEAAEADRLAKAEADAVAARQFRGTRIGDRVKLSGWLDLPGWELIRTALDPLAKRTPGPDGTPDGRGKPRRDADALIELARRSLASGGLPETGGEATQLIVRIDYDTLKAGVGAGTLPSGNPISAAEARKMACEAGIIPAVFGGTSQTLDLGRSQRLFTGAVRKALIARDGGCTFPHGCYTPPAGCIGHHMVEWADGGETSPDNGTLTCRTAHWHTHHDGWTARLNNADGLPEWVPPKWLNQNQTPRRHPRLPPPRAPG